MEKEACFPSKGNGLCKTFRECLVNGFTNQYVMSRNKFNSVARRFGQLHTTLSSMNTHFLLLPPSFLIESHESSTVLLKSIKQLLNKFISIKEIQD